MMFDTNQPSRALAHFRENLFVVSLMMLNPILELEPPAVPRSAHFSPGSGRSSEGTGDCDVPPFARDHLAPFGRLRRPAWVQ